MIDFIWAALPLITFVVFMLAVLVALRGIR